MKQLSARKSKPVLQYILSDYHFLQDYQILSSDKTNNSTFVANIKNTSQKVRFVKHKYTQQLLPRFTALHNLHKNGIILADNMFILEQCEEFYYYVIEAQIDIEDSRFQTLNHYLYSNTLDEQQTKSILGKIKILVDCLHQQGQSFAGLDPRKIIIDDEKHLYLAPFDLQLQLKADNYSRAYYPPEILSKINQQQEQINQQMMQKWDIWSFGCISLQLLLYQSPFFLTTSLPKQLALIKTTNITDQLTNLDQQIKNMITNSLSAQTTQRNISTRVNNICEAQKEQVELGYEQTIKHITNIKKQQTNHHGHLKQLNIHQQNQGNCVFTLHLLTLNNIDFEKQLHVSVSIGKTFHFYLDYDQKSPRKYTVNRKITIRANFQDFCKWLSQPISIQLQQKDKKCKIIINAQGLTMIDQNQRLWNQPIIGNYSSSVKSDFPKARFKVNCNLITPQNLLQEGKTKQKEQICEKQKKVKETQEKQSFDKNKKSFQQKKPKQSQPLKQLPQNKLNLTHKRQNSSKAIPSISQISQNISKLNEQLKKKIQSTQYQPQQDQIKKQLSSLLEIQ